MKLAEKRGKVERGEGGGGGEGGGKRENNGRREATEGESKFRNSGSMLRVDRTQKKINFIAFNTVSTVNSMRT